jgi:thiamine pyrophosphate-dependent acetolactate synthase large subunit-like protein
MIKLSHYIAGQLADWGVRHVFLVPGGGAMHLNDSFARESRTGYQWIPLEDTICRTARWHAAEVPA